MWSLRIDINIINHDGNLIDCASIAALAALMHFHRPDVTSTGEEIIIHPASEKDFLPLTLFHYPVCVSFITFEKLVRQSKIIYSFNFYEYEIINFNLVQNRIKAFSHFLKDRDRSDFLYIHMNNAASF